MKTYQEKAEKYVREKLLYGGKYKVFEDGSVYSYKTQRFLKGCVTNVGYKQVDLFNENNKKVRCSIHRLVAEAFIPNPENKPQVNHKDGDRLNNYIKNLEWATSSENNAHTWSAGGKKNTKSSAGEKFIYEHKGLFRIRVTLNGEMIYVGMYKKLEDAVEARDRYLSDLRLVA